MGGARMPRDEDAQDRSRKVGTHRISLPRRMPCCCAIRALPQQQPVDGRRTGGRVGTERPFWGVLGGRSDRGRTARPIRPSPAPITIFTLIVAWAASHRAGSACRGTRRSVARAASADTTVPTIRAPYRPYLAW